MAKGTILIIDDEPLILRGIEDLLTDSVDKVYTSLSGKDGLEILRKNKIHAIVCDINMPEMNGMQVIAQVRKENFEVPFIFFTAHGSRDLMLEAAKYGIFGFINKPNFEELYEVIPQALKKGLDMENNVPVETIDDVLNECKDLLADLDKEKNSRG